MTTPRGFGINAAIEESVIAPVAREAEALGYSSFWTNNTPGADGLQVLRNAGNHTSTIKLGVGVIPVHQQSTDEIIDLSGKDTERELPMQRLYLGIGAAGPGALDLVRVSVERLREQLGCQIFLAALGPKMCRLAGEIADGVLFNWLTPDYARRSAELVREGAEQADRPAPRLMTYVRVALGEASREKLSSEAERYAGIPAYGAHFERMGVDGVGASVAANDSAGLQDQLRDWDGVLDEIVVRAITPNDSLEETMELVRAAAPTDARE